jgi:mgtE-like transporter
VTAASDAETGADGLGTWRARSIVATMFPLLVVLSMLEMGSGFVLESLESTYVDNPTLLVLVPVMIGMGGNLGAIFSARLSTRLHLGTLSFDPRDEALRANVVAVMALATTVFAALGGAAWVVGRTIASPMAVTDLFVISLVSGLLLAVLAVGISIVATYVSYQRGLDPDDITIPVVTNVCDVLGVLVLSGVATLVL